MTRPPPNLSRWRRLAWGLGGAILVMVTIAFGRAAVYPYPVGPEQPLPFSHHVHATDREISCLFCHDAADRSQDAGMPPVEKCLLCHSVIATQFPPIQDLRRYADREEPIPWERVYQVPDYVRFNHEVHLTAGVDCGQCHGDVKQMDRVILAQPITMGFCIDCHRKNDARVDCTICHY